MPTNSVLCIRHELCFCHICVREFIPTGQIVSSIFYYSVSWYLHENVRWQRKILIFGDKRTSCASQHASSHAILFITYFLTRNNMIVILLLSYLLACFSPPWLLFVPLTEAQVEMIQAEMQDTLTEHNFQDAFKKWQICWDQYVHAERDYFKVDGIQ